ncbi:MAG: glycosyltransferase family 4 protein [Candidatus Sumerlaeia bacterium]|nr:glycosyltransferase family 4 protein [Candidatus Sumerlaeia bacterium]
MAIIHQILPNLEFGDAIGNFALLLRRLLRQMGHRSSIYARFIHPRLRLRARSLRAARRLFHRPDVVWMYHYSTASEITPLIRTVAGPLLVIYHSVTPPALTLDGAGGLAARCHIAQDALRSLAGVACIAAGVSEYDRTQLVAAGFRTTEVLPIVLDDARFAVKPNPSILRRYEDGYVNFLTVGRVVPHKKIEDVIGVFHYYHDAIQPRSRLWVVGDLCAAPAYAEQLAGFCRYLGLGDVCFTGKVAQRDLIAFYRAAHVYLCMSEHEGFCVPLLESMTLGVPVIAYKCAAVAETLGDAGVLVREKRFDVIGEMAHLLVSDSALRRRIVEKQRLRAAEFREEALRDKLAGLLRQVVPTL